MNLRLAAIFLKLRLIFTEKRESRRERKERSQGNAFICRYKASLSKSDGSISPQTAYRQDVSPVTECHLLVAEIKHDYGENGTGKLVKLSIESIASFRITRDGERRIGRTVFQ